MRIAVIGSTGRTGRLLVAQALDRGHEVIALARTPERLADLAEETARAPALRIVAADVAEPAGVVDAARGADAIVSGLGVSRGQDAQILAAGARAVCSAGPRVVWLGALGTARRAARWARSTTRCCAGCSGTNGRPRPSPTR